MSSNNLGPKIKARRQELKLSQRGLAKKCGIRQAAISEIENGAGFTQTTLCAILKGLGGTLKIDWKTP